MLPFRIHTGVVVPVVLPEGVVAEIAARAGAAGGYALTVDLEACEVRDEMGLRAPFAIDEFRRRCLLEGLDDIGLTLRHEAEIKAYEDGRPRWRDPQTNSPASS